MEFTYHAMNHASQSSSSVGPKMDLTIGDTNNVTWLAGGGLNVHTSTTILSPGAATKIINGCVVSDEVTLEAWVQPVNGTQTLSRIIALAEYRTYRNAMQAQACTERSECDGDEYRLRVRTTDTDDKATPSSSRPEPVLRGPKEPSSPASPSAWSTPETVPETRSFTWMASRQRPAPVTEPW